MQICPIPEWKETPVRNNRNILECKSETLEDVDKKADGNNRNILECK